MRYLLRFAGLHDGFQRPATHSTAELMCMTSNTRIHSIVKTNNRYGHIYRFVFISLIKLSPVHKYIVLYSPMQRVRYPKQSYTVSFSKEIGDSGMLYASFEKSHIFKLASRTMPLCPTSIWSIVSGLETSDDSSMLRPGGSYPK